MPRIRVIKEFYRGEDRRQNKVDRRHIVEQRASGTKDRRKTGEVIKNRFNSNPQRLMRALEERDIGRSIRQEWIDAIEKRRLQVRGTMEEKIGAQIKNFIKLKFSDKGTDYVLAINLENGNIFWTSERRKKTRRSGFDRRSNEGKIIEPEK